MLRSKTGSIALRLAEVQPPNVAATLSVEMSFCAFSANVGQSEAPSSTTGLSCLPSTPPAALISSIASSSASRTETSEIAIVPLSECRMPTGIVSPPGVPPEVDADGVSSLSPQPAMPNASAMPAAAIQRRPAPPSMGRIMNPSTCRRTARVSGVCRGVR